MAPIINTHQVFKHRLKLTSGFRNVSNLRITKSSPLKRDWRFLQETYRVKLEKGNLKGVSVSWTKSVGN